MKLLALFMRFVALALGLFLLVVGAILAFGEPPVGGFIGFPLVGWTFVALGIGLWAAIYLGKI